jgi:KaiC/GvpD/RAD55 family RecA-like ATPase
MTKRLHRIVDERRLELIEWQKDPEKHRPVSTGKRSLDELFGGFPRYPFYFAFLGLFKSGKSTAALDLTLALCANSGVPTALYMLEESNREVADRVISKSSNMIGRTNIFKLTLTPEMFDEMKVIVDECEEMIYHVNDELSNLEAIYVDAKTIGATQIVIDNFQLLTGEKGASRREQLEAASQRIMRARQAGITTFLVSQGNATDGSFGSSQVQKDANIVLSISEVHVDPTDKHSPMATSQRRITVLQSRFSKQGVHTDIFFDGEHSRFMDLEEKMPDDPEFYVATLDRPGNAFAHVDIADPEPEMEEQTIRVIQ